MEEEYQIISVTNESTKKKSREQLLEEYKKSKK